MTEKRIATERAILGPLSLDEVAGGLRNLFRLYKLSEPDGDTLTFVSWILDELNVDLDLRKD